ncbi:MAG: phosphotransferase, partial [Candidatus Aureabacteria bacterium]|nr:phosphotransferase [Candidatus Auribacterota bacterium]
MKRQKLKKEISERKVRQIMRHAFHGEVKIKSISLLKGGFFNTCYKVTFEKRRPVILRISPSREKALLGHERALLRREARLLSEIRKGGIPVPRILFRDFTGRVIPRDYIIMEYREGAN